METITSWGLIPFSEIRKSLPEDRFIRIDGQDIYVEQAGSGEALLLLHGFAASTYTFREIIPLLARNFRVIAVDLNGFGFTERPRLSEAYHPDVQVQILFKLMDSLGIREFSVIGHSYGSVLGWLQLLQHPDRIRHLAMISPPSSMKNPPSWLRFESGRLFAFGMVHLLLSGPKRFRKVVSRAYHQKEKLTAEVSEEYRRRLRIEGLFDAIMGFGKVMSGGNLNMEFGPIETPLMILAGAHDAVVDCGAVKKFAEKFPRSRFEILTKSGHSAPEEEPDLVAALLGGFFLSQVSTKAF